MKYLSHPKLTQNRRILTKDMHMSEPYTNEILKNATDIHRQFCLVVIIYIIVKEKKFF